MCTLPYVNIINTVHCYTSNGVLVCIASVVHKDTQKRSCLAHRLVSLIKFSLLYMYTVAHSPCIKQLERGDFWLKF